MKFSKIENFGKRVARSGKNQVNLYKDYKKKTEKERGLTQRTAGGGGVIMCFY